MIKMWELSRIELRNKPIESFEMDVFKLHSIYAPLTYRNLQPFEDGWQWADSDIA